MASRTIYIPNTSIVGVIEKNVEFEWFPGFSISQKQKSIKSLHAAGNALGIDPILEISSKSLQKVGVKCSAFNLEFKTKKSGRPVSVESAFQGSKVFKFSGPFPEVYSKNAREARKEVKLSQNGPLIKFTFFGKDFPISPITYFYDWIYIKTLRENLELANEVTKFSGFTDIEFNSEKSLNCQAYSAALFVSLAVNEIIEEATTSTASFLRVLSDHYEQRDKRRKFQSSMI